MNFLQKNDLISHNQLGFKPGDSCTNHLLLITHEIFKSSDNGFDFQGVVLDIKSVWWGMTQRCQIQMKTKRYFK